MLLRHILSHDKAASFLWQKVISIKPKEGQKRKARKQTQLGKDEDEGDLGEDAMDSATGLINAGEFLPVVWRNRL